MAFLGRYGDLNGMACPTGRGSANDEPVKFLPCDTTRNSVHVFYREAWQDFMDATIENSATQRQKPDGPLTKDLFCKVGKQYYPLLRIMESGSDFYDTCTKLANFASTSMESVL